MCVFLVEFLDHVLGCYLLYKFVHATASVLALMTFLSNFKCIAVDQCCLSEAEKEAEAITS